MTEPTTLAHDHIERRAPHSFEKHFRAVDKGYASTPSSVLQARRIALFCLMAFGLTWLAALPLWLGPGLDDPGLVLVCAGAAMMTPAIAAIIMARFGEGRAWRRVPRGGRDRGEDDIASGRDTVLASLGLRARMRRRPFVIALAVGLVVPVVLLLTSELFAGLVGATDIDLTLRQTAEDIGLSATASALEAWLAFGGRLLIVMVLGAAALLVVSLGEEIGWRGYLMPRLEQLGGRPMAIVVGGVIWGLWHAPLILLGYNYPDEPPAVAVLAMVAACVGAGGFLYWLTVRFRSIWPAVIAHGANNAASGIVMGALLMPGATVDVLNGSAMGWPGWIVYSTAVVIGFILIRRRRLAFPAGPTESAMGTVR